MIDIENSKSGSGNVLRTIGAVTALLTAIAGLVGALAAIGVFDDDPGVGQTVVVEEPSDDQAAFEGSGPIAAPRTPAIDVRDVSETQSGETRQAEVQPVDDRTTVTLAYLGDAEGCNLGIAIDIGDRSYLPIGSSFPAGDVPTGTQSYTISGTIVCPFSGQCEAFGTGTVDVAPGRTFFVQWLNTDFGVCDITLAT